jgi:hypothetical protein
MKRTASDAEKEHTEHTASSFSEISEENGGTSTKRKLIFVEESADFPSVGSHHGGSFDVYMTHKVAKLRSVHRGEEIEKESKIFEGCIVYVNGVTNPPIEEIRRLVTIHGGECVNYRVFQVTHFVCDYFTDAQLKVELARQRLYTERTKMYNVTAAWITQSIAQGRKLNESEFVPSGLKLRTGVDIAQMFQKVASNQPNLETSRPQTISIIDSEHDSDGFADFTEKRSVDLTFSQQQFLHAIPRDLRDEALQQIAGATKSGFMEVDQHSDRTKFDQRDLIEEGVQSQLFELVTVVFGPKLNVFQSCANRKLRQQIRSILENCERSLSNSDGGAITAEIMFHVKELQQLFFCFGCWMLERELLEQVSLFRVFV